MWCIILYALETNEAFHYSIWVSEFIEVFACVVPVTANNEDLDNPFHLCSIISSFSSSQKSSKQQQTTTSSLLSEAFIFVDNGIIILCTFIHHPYTSIYLYKLPISGIIAQALLNELKWSGLFDTGSFSG